MKAKRRTLPSNALYKYLKQKLRVHRIKIGDKIYRAEDWPMADEIKVGDLVVYCANHFGGIQSSEVCEVVNIGDLNAIHQPRKFLLRIIKAKSGIKSHYTIGNICISSITHHLKLEIKTV